MLVVICPVSHDLHIGRRSSQDSLLLGGEPDNNEH
jgi:hypothetical protein